MAIARQEVRSALRGRMLLGFGLIFTVLCLGIALAGLGGSGQIMVQGYTRTAVSLLAVSVYLLPLFGLILGASAFGNEDGGTELVLAQPIGRTQVLIGRAFGLAAALSATGLLGFAVAGVLVGAQTGTAGLAGYLLVAGGATAVGIAGLSPGMLVGIAARRRGAAVGWALTFWFVAAVLYDLVAIGILQVVGSGHPGPWLVGILVVNPIDGVRTLGLVGLGADVLLGPTGAALSRMMGVWGGSGLVIASLICWMAAPLAATAALYRRRDW